MWGFENINNKKKVEKAVDAVAAGVGGVMAAGVGVTAVIDRIEHPIVPPVVQAHVLDQKAVDALAQPSDHGMFVKIDPEAGKATVHIPPTASAPVHEAHSVADKQVQ